MIKNKKNKKKIKNKLLNKGGNEMKQKEFLYNDGLSFEE